MLSVENNEASVGEADTVSSASSSVSINTNELSSLVTASERYKDHNKESCSTKDHNKEMCFIKDLSNNQSDAASALCSTSSDIYCSVDESISSQAFALSSLPSISSQNSHWQDTISSTGLKHSSHSLLNHGVSNDEPLKKKIKIEPGEITGSSKNTLSCEILNPSERAINIISPIDYTKINIDYAEENNFKELNNLDTILNSKLVVKQQCEIKSCLKSLSSPSENCEIDSTSSNSGDEENSGKNYFELLPAPIIEYIFRQLRFSDLMTSSSVCKMWNTFITNTKFLQWKKAYYCMKSDLKFSDSKCWLTILTFLIKRKMCPKNCFRLLISFMGNEFKKKPPHGIKIFLRNIPSCVIAERLLLERFSDKPLLYTNPWCILAVTVILSPTFEDLYDVFYRLINVYQCDYVTIFEVAFCIAAILLHFTRHCSINHGFHYRLLHVIYLFENALPVNPVVPSLELEETKLPEHKSSRELYQSPVPNITLTYEQIAILNHKLAPNQIVKIFAFAGTGKTTTLLHFAKKHPNLKFLYIPSMESSCNYAASLFPSNVDCKTVYSMAHEAVGKLYEHKMKTELKADDIFPFVHQWPAFVRCMSAYIETILNTIHRFIKSGDEHITLDHVQSNIQRINDYIRLYNQDDENMVHKKEYFHLIILNEAQELWEKMTSKENEDCKITANIYLKIFLLSRPSFQQYNCIMIDEAEGFNSAVLQYLLSLKIPVILAGDYNQKIRDAHYQSAPWPYIPVTHTYHLTKSFRFGHKIAYVANCCCEVFTLNTQSILIGTLKESHVDGTIKGQYAVITRTDKLLFVEAIRLCCTSERRPNEPQNFRGAFVGGIGLYAFDQIVDIYRLKCKTISAIECSFIKKFENFNKLEKYAYFEDKDLYGKISLVNEHGAEILNYLNIIKQKCSFDLAEADVVFGKVQYAKGLEFDTVRMTNDFCQTDISSYPPFLFAHCLAQTSRGLCRLKDDHGYIYTALTRAKTCLVMPEHLYLTLLQAQEEFQYLAESSTVLNDAESLTCVLCSTTFIPSTFLTLVCRNIILTSGRPVQDGPVCKDCATSRNYRYDINFGPLNRIENFYNITMSFFLK